MKIMLIDSSSEEGITEQLNSSAEEAFSMIEEDGKKNYAVVIAGESLI
jgi:hypothetical protein